MKVAIVHDWLTGMGGGERFVVLLREIFPDAPIYTTVYRPENLVKELQEADVRTSFLQKKKKAIKNHQKYLHHMPMAFESFDLNEYDVVISSSSSCAHGVVTNPNTFHLCYCHTPMRYAWEFYYDYTKDFKGIKKKLIPYVMNYIRLWDKVSADRVDLFIANSLNTAGRIKKHYRREPLVMNLPIDTNYFTLKEKEEDFYLVLSRLVSYKRVDIAVEACTKLNKKLVVIGVGAELDKLKKMAGPTVKFLGGLSDEEIVKYYQGAKAFLFPGEEDYGLTPLEAQSCGTPVIAYKKGGVLETVVDNKTGLFFDEQNAQSLIDAITKFETMKFDKNVVRAHAQTFDREKFKQDLLNLIKENVKK